jgi:hypothetical protein
VSDEWSGGLIASLIDSVEISSAAEGMVRTQPRLRVAMLPGTPRTELTLLAARLDVICEFAGPVAEARCSAGAVGVLFGINHWMAVLQQQALTHPSVEEWLATRAEEVPDDLAQIIWRLHWMHYDDMMGEARRLALIAAWVVEVEWPGIMRMSHMLREEQQMTGDEFEEAWRAVRPGETTRQRRRCRAQNRCGFMPPEAGLP